MGETAVLDPPLEAVAETREADLMARDRRPRRDPVDEHSEIRRLATELAATVATVRTLTERLSPIPEKFATLSEEVRGMKGAVEGMQARIQMGDSAFEALRTKQALQGARLDKIESSLATGKSYAWDVFLKLVPYAIGAGIAAFVLWIKSL